jgi:hypothetical protein
MHTKPEALLRAARLVEQAVPLRLTAELVGSHYEIGFAQRVHPGQHPVRPGDVDTVTTARGKLRASLQVAATRLEGIDGWELLGSRRQGALIAWLEGQGPKGWRQGMAALPAKAIRAARQDPIGLKKVDDLLAGGDSSRSQAVLSLWQAESDGWLTLQARRDTQLKRAPLPVEWLQGEGLAEVAQGSLIEVLALDSIASSSHDWVVIADRPERWVIDWADWQLCGVDHEPQSPACWRRHGALITPHLSVGDLLRFDMRRRPATGSAREAALLRLAHALEPALAAWESSVSVCGLNEEDWSMDLVPCCGDVKDLGAWLQRRWSGGLSVHASAGFVRIDARETGGRLCSVTGAAAGTFAADLFHARGGVAPAGKCRGWEP